MPDAPHSHPTAGRPAIGGQAVLEGVMMRGPRSWSVACRRPDESIAVEDHPLPTLAQRKPWLQWPLLRGCYVLGESLAIGMRALMISTNQALEEEEQLTDKQLVWTITVAMVLFSAIFIVLPVFGTRLIEHFFKDLKTSRLLFTVVEGCLRIGLFVAYLTVIGQFKDVRRLFQYHGAEHKTIYAYENADELVPAEIDRKYSTLHVRCGTNFLFIVLFLTIIAHFALDVAFTPTFWARILIRLAAIPFLAGISYEVIKFASRNENSALFKIAMLPGLALQKITTKPPTLDQIEVAIAAMQAVTRDLDDLPAISPQTPVS
ncbi:MAG: DUF1385 domain-containing protein [Actinomycetota bacterium]